MQSGWLSETIHCTVLVVCLHHLCSLCSTSVLGYQLNDTRGSKYNHITDSPCSNCSHPIKIRKHKDLLRDRALIRESDLPPPEVDVNTCVIQGKLTYAHNWYGYLGIFKIVPEGGKIYFKFTYRQDNCCMKLLLYLTEDVDILRARMTCMQKQAIIHPQSDQVIMLSPTSKHSGCKKIVNSEGEQLLECRSGRRLTSADTREWYLAISNCGSPVGLHFEYSLIVFGHVGKCPEITTNSKSAGLQHSYILILLSWVLVVISCHLSILL